MTASAPLLVEAVDGVVTLTLQRPHARNALNMELKVALAEALRSLRLDPSVRSLVLTGAGPAFCAGGDITEMDPARRPSETYARFARLLDDVVLPLASFPTPVVAAVNGPAFGLGLALALSCDFVVVAEGAALSASFARVGLGPDGCTSYLLPRLVGLHKAKELLFLAEPLSPEDALRIGLVSRVVPAGTALAAATSVAARLAAGPTAAYAVAKRLVNQSHATSMERMGELESAGQAITMATADHREGIAAFDARRPAVFRGR